MISNYSFFDINADTLNIALAEAIQFGRTLWRLLYRIHHANFNFCLVNMSKVDLFYGSYTLWLHPKDMLRFTILFPAWENKPALVGIPLTNPMGWVSSPPNFSTCTETAYDLANEDLKDVEATIHAGYIPHRLDVVSESSPVGEYALTTALGP